MEQIAKLIKVQRIVFWYMLLVNVSFFFVIEFFLLDIGAIFTDEPQLEFILLCVMILATLGVIYSALRLFKFEWVKRRIEEDTIARYHDLALARIETSSGIAIFNLIFYWFFLNTSFLWLFVIILLSLPFIYPSKERFYNESGYIDK